MVASLLLAIPMTFYVSPNGRDTNPGTARAPFATIDGVQAVLRTLPTGPQRPAVTVKLSGTFHLTKALVLGPEVSGVKFVGPATISGATELKNWRKAEFNGHSVWVTNVPEGPDFRELFIGKSGFRAPRTQIPESGFYNFAGYANDADAKAPWNEGQSSARFKPGDLNPKWQNLADVELVAHHYWVTSRLPIADIDPSNGVVKFAKKSVFKLADDYSGQAAPYTIVNVAEALHTPGQWYHNKPTHQLYYFPKAGQRMDRLVAYAPRIPALLQLNGSNNTTIENVDFRYSEYTLPADSSGDIQAAVNVTGAVQLTNCVNPVISHCQIQHVGSYALEVLGHSKGCRVERTLMQDLGGGGVKLGHGTQATTVADCSIRAGGRLFASGEGIWVGLSGGNQIIYNQIQDFYYTGISVGWDWGFRDTSAKNNFIAFNDISDIGQNQLSDLGGIYVLGKQPGSQIYNNRIQNIQARGYGGWGIYLDEGSTGWTVENNIVLHTKTGGFHIHYGGHNLVKNNIFAYAKTEGQLIRQRDDQQGPIRFERNLVVANPTDAPLVVANWLKRDVLLTGMLYATPKGPLPFGDDGTGRFITVKLDQDGQPPQDSEVYKQGFHPIPSDQFGPRLR